MQPDTTPKPIMDVSAPTRENSVPAGQVPVHPAPAAQPPGNVASGKAQPEAARTQQVSPGAPQAQVVATKQTRNQQKQSSAAHSGSKPIAAIVMTVLCMLILMALTVMAYISTNGSEGL